MKLDKDQKELFLDFIIKSRPHLVRRFLKKQKSIEDNLKPISAAKEVSMKIQAEKVEAAKVEAAKVEAAKVEAAKVEAAKVEAAKVEAAKVEANKPPKANK